MITKAAQFIKGGFSFRLKSKFDVWMRGFNETQVQTGAQFEECRQYIEDNPVRKRMVGTAAEYPYSSAGSYPMDPMPLHFRG